MSIWTETDRHEKRRNPRDSRIAKEFLWWKSMYVNDKSLSKEEDEEKEDRQTSET